MLEQKIIATLKLKEITPDYIIENIICDEDQFPLAYYLFTHLIFSKSLESFMDYTLYNDDNSWLSIIENLISYECNKCKKEARFMLYDLKLFFWEKTGILLDNKSDGGFTIYYIYTFFNDIVLTVKKKIKDETSIYYMMENYLLNLENKVYLDTGFNLWNQFSK